MTVEILTGDAEATLRTLPTASCHMCVTSPPFFGLRDYGVDGQIGLEATPDEWVARLVAVFREVARVLRPDGTLWLEVGDSYAADAKWGGRSGCKNETSAAGGYPRTRRRTGLKPKDLIGAPWQLAFALRADGWYLRSDIIWARQNPMPESVRDRPTKAHSYVFLLSRSPRYFWDADAIAEVSLRAGDIPGGTRRGYGDAYVKSGWGHGEVPPTRNSRSVWSIPTQPLSEPHYAAFPEALASRCILAGTSERGVCPDCAAPWRRLTTEAHDAEGRTTNGQKPRTDERRGFDVRMVKTTSTVGWEPGCLCGHEYGPDGEFGGGGPMRPVPATVLDPFLGSGTTALAARKLGRRCVGIELSPEYVEIAWRRLRDPAALNRAAHAADGPAQLALTPDREAR